MDAPTRPATISPASTGASSRVIASETTPATAPSAEKRAKPVWLWSASTMPLNSVVSATTGSE